MLSLINLNNELSKTENYFSHSFVFGKTNQDSAKPNAVFGKTNQDIAKPKTATVDPFCETKTVFNTSELSTFLKQFYNNTNLYYGRNRGPFVYEKETLTKKLAECYLKLLRQIKLTTHLVWTRHVKRPSLLN